MACNLLYSDYQLLKNVKHKTFPAATIMSQMWYAVEDMILQAWTEHALIGLPKHLSLHFDGIRISTDHIGDVAEYIRGCQDAIKAKTGFEVKISAKTHGSFMKLLKKRSAASKTVPAKLLDPGNCIPCGVWHTVPLSRPALVTAIQNAERADNIEAMKVKLRSYRSVASMCDLELLCCVGLPPSHVQSFVMHYEGDGSPHCVAVKIEKSSNAVTVIDGTEQYKLQQEIFRDSYHGAVDRSTIISYWKRDPRDKPESKASMLLDMVAGAAASSESEKDCQPHERDDGLMYDEDDVPVIRDGILERLQAEAETLAKRLSRRAHPVEGRHACPACPFRSFRVRERRQLRVHFAKYHSAKNQFVCSGTKQLKVILALSDHAASSQTSACDLLETSATIMRSTVVPPLGATLHHIDKRIRLVYKAAGPVYVNADSIGTTLHVRRARNTYYAQDFTDLLLREAVLCHAQAPECSASKYFCLD